MNTFKLRKIFPKGLFVEKCDLIQVIEKQEIIMCDLMHQILDIHKEHNLQITNKHHDALVKSIKDTWK
jgi:hypothetical protein